MDARGAGTGGVSTNRFSGLPPTNRRSLEDRLRNLARADGVLVQRVRRQLSALVVTEMLSRVAMPTGGPPMLVKGGTALEFRFGVRASRSSKDLDAVVRGDLDHFVRHLRSTIGRSWAGFTGRIVHEAEVRLPGVNPRPRRFEVKLCYLDQPFATVPVEVSCAEGRAAIEYDEIAAPSFDRIGFEPSVPVPCLSARYQVAQKIHACTDPLTPGVVNTRARDIVDLLLLAPLVIEGLAGVRTACEEIFAIRGRHSWPPELRVPPVWSSLYREAMEGLEGRVPADVRQAAAEVRALIGAISVA